MFNRMRLVAAAAALVATAPLATIGTAHAEQAAGEAKPERTIKIKGVEPRDGVFFVKGSVEPAYKERFAILESKLKSENSWSKVRKFTTTDESTYRERVQALKRPGQICYRVKIKGNDTFATSVSSRVCIRTFSSN